MKKLLLILSFLIMFASSALAGTSNITLEWDANTELDLAGYREG